MTGSHEARGSSPLFSTRKSRLNGDRSYLSGILFFDTPSRGAPQRMEVPPDKMAYLGGPTGQASLSYDRPPLYGLETYVVRNDLIVFKPAYIAVD